MGFITPLVPFAERRIINMKKIKHILSMILLAALVLMLTGSVFANEDDCKLTSRELLQKTGMDEATLSEMDDELMDYISENLCSQVEDIDDVTWIPTSVELSDTRMEGSRNTQLLTNGNFVKTARCFR